MTAGRLDHGSILACELEQPAWLSDVVQLERVPDSAAGGAALDQGDP